MPTLDDMPDAAEFGLYVADAQKAVNPDGTKRFKNAAEAIAAFGGPPNGRSWGKIHEDTKAVMRSYPKGE